MVKSYWEWRDEFCFSVLHDYVEEQKRVMFLQTWPRGSWIPQSAPASAICLTCSYMWNALARNLLWLMPFPNPSSLFLNWCCRQVNICLFEVVCCRNTVQDKKSCLYIRSFHSSALLIMEYFPNAEWSYSSPACSKPIWTVAWVPGYQPTSWGAGCEVGVSTMRGLYWPSLRCLTWQELSLTGLRQ